MMQVLETKVSENRDSCVVKIRSSKKAPPDMIQELDSGARQLALKAAADAGIVRPGLGDLGGGRYQPCDVNGTPLSVADDSKRLDHYQAFVRINSGVTNH